MVDGIVNYGDNLAMEVVGEEQDQMISWDDIINSPQDLILDLGFLEVDSPESTTTTTSSSSPTAAEAAAVPPSELGASFSIDQIEDFLFNDVDHDDYGTATAADDFLSDLLLDSPLPSSTTTTATNSDHEDNNRSSSPDIVSLQQHHSPSPPPPLFDHSQSPQLEVPLKDSPSPPQEGSQQGSPRQPEGENEEDEQDADDPISKKRKRQIRNRDAAVRSRERKKMYVRDLEMKSRFYESECRRLGMLLQCYVAENHALRLSLHSSNSSQAFGASTTRQESAVLLLGEQCSLLLF
ncbi:OLC1v1016192C1 [Oldenlandia corymbosa var. corymbosa]|uniref:OLC1v1016192C1 n=1 Tax=Oldenlandia corymbosa var. corymbosa TaxID=529605 RepID=A0AAV1E7B1_OLDCO|nr:OLC1v1016192C1 [Oldenlandia corymbosa var. corymbosa]